MFGSALHVSGRDEQALRRAVAAVAGQRRVQDAETSLEDFFIYMMRRSRDNFEAAR